jgi:hypothetical protein
VEGVVDHIVVGEFHVVLLTHHRVVLLTHVVLSGLT